MDNGTLHRIDVNGIRGGAKARNTAGATVHGPGPTMLIALRQCNQGYQFYTLPRLGDCQETPERNTNH
jgi:hypothetical protein